MDENPVATVTTLEPLLTTEELAAYLKVPVKTLYEWRLKNKGPAAIRVGRSLRYSETAVREFLDEQTFRLTA